MNRISAIRVGSTCIIKPWFFVLFYIVYSEIVVFLRIFGILEIIQKIQLFGTQSFQIFKFGTIFAKLFSKSLRTFFFTSEVDAELPLALRKNIFKRVGVHSRVCDQHRDEVTAKTTESNLGPGSKEFEISNRVPKTIRIFEPKSKNIEHKLQGASPIIPFSPVWQSWLVGRRIDGCVYYCVARTDTTSNSSGGGCRDAEPEQPEQVPQAAVAPARKDA